MVTHYPQIASGERLRAASDANRADIGFFARLLTWLRQAYCALHGHDRLLHFEKDRMSLRCVSCGHESPGWEFNDRARPVVRAHGEMRRPALRPQLVRTRRIA
jgi:hypothetical protein